MKDLEHIEMAKGIAEIVMGLPPDQIQNVIANPDAALAPLLAGAGIAPDDIQRVVFWANYEVRYQLYEAAQQKALQLLRRFLTREQRTELRKRIFFTVIGSAGGRYRLAPHGSRIASTTEINGRWYDATAYCYNDPEGILLPADVMLGTMFLLMTDEPGFLAEANAHQVTRFGRSRQAAVPQ